MKNLRTWRLASVALALLLGPLLLLGPVAALPWANPAAFSSPGFASQWARTDAEAVRANRSWYWGPAPWFDYFEFYRQSPNGLRQVQYFDKARMEINQPSENAVTNGLLVVEMVSGQQKLGDDPYDTGPRGAAAIPLAGDPGITNPTAPTYGSFSGIATIADPTRNRDPERLGESINATLDRSGAKGTNDDLARAYADQTRLVRYIPATGHNIPAVFWDFLNLTGPIVVEGRVETGAVVEWVVAMGYPITDPYWIRTRVGGVEREVLVQLFERRTLTYTPTNQAGFQVEMGNVGQHYFLWRYPHLGPAWAAGPPPLSIFFASKRAGARWEVYRMGGEGDNQAQFVPSGNGETLAYSVARVYGGPENQWVLLDSRRGDGVRRQLYAVAYNNGTELQRLTYTDGSRSTPPPAYPRPSQASDDYNPAVSPDGTKLVFVSDRGGTPQLQIMPFRPGRASPEDIHLQLTTNPCANQAPSWSPDGRGLVWMSNCGGDFEILRGDLHYFQDRFDPGAPANFGALGVTLVNIRPLTDNDRDDMMPRWSPDGKKIAFQSSREGASAIYLMDADGGGQVRLTRGPGGDEAAPTWSPDGTQLVFSHQSGGRWSLVRVNADGGDRRQLTTSGGDDHWAIWAQ